MLQMAQELRTTNTGRQKDCACSYDLNFGSSVSTQTAEWRSQYYLRNQDIDHNWALVSYLNKKKKLKQSDEPGGRQMLDSSKWLHHLLCVLGKVHKFSEPQFLCLQVGENTIALQLLIYNPQISKPHTHTHTHKKTFFKETHLAVKSNWSELICHKILPWTGMKLFTVCVYFIYCQYTCFATELWIYSLRKV